MASKVEHSREVKEDEKCLFNKASRRALVTFMRVVLAER